MPVIANPDIAKVMRLASLLLLSSTPSSLSTPHQDLHVTSPMPLGIPSHMRTLVSPAMILSQDTPFDNPVSWI